jgi:hypothetical protein
MSVAMKTLKSNFATLDRVERQNLRRLLADTGFFAAFSAIAFVMKGLSDDDDDKDSWMTQLMAYIGLRTANEMNSQIFEPLLFKNAIDRVKSPIAPMRQLEELLSLKSFSTEEIRTGPYRNHSRIYKLFIDNFWSKNFYRLQAGNLRYSISGWLKFNSDYLFWFPDE